MKKDTKFLRSVMSSDDIYLTKTKIAVRHISSGGYETGRPWLKDTIHYYNKTPKRVSAAQRIVGRIPYRGR